MVGHIYIYGEIGNWQISDSQDYGVVSLKSVVDSLELNKEADEIVVHIHSVGGDVYEGLAIHDVLKASGKKITTRVEGLCASIATVILLAGEEREATPNSQIYVHNAWTFAVGDADDLKKVSEGLQKYNDIIKNIYTSNTNLTDQEAEQFMNEETEFTTVQALENGFITKEANELKAVARINTNNMDLEKIKKKLGFSNKEEPKNVVIALEDGTMVNSSSTEAVPQVGDAWDVEGVAIASDTYNTKEGYVVKIENGKVTEANKSEEPEIDVKSLKASMETLKADFEKEVEEKESLKAQLSEFEETKQLLVKSVERIDNLNDTIDSLKAKTSVDFNDSKLEESDKEEVGIRFKNDKK